MSKEHQFDVGSGDIFYVIGANGSGKSALLHQLYCANKKNEAKDKISQIIWIAAHRQTSLNEKGIGISHQQRIDFEQSISSANSNSSARYLDIYSLQKQDITLLNLIDAENKYNRDFIQKIVNKDLKTLEDINNKANNISPLGVLNNILLRSNIKKEIKISDNYQIIACNNNGQEYEIAKLSDGERAAILIASSILTAPQESLILLDEPEKHLHHTIVAPLLHDLFRERKDCSFVVSTHNLNLAKDKLASKIILVRDIRWENTKACWNLDIVDDPNSIDDEFKNTIIGSKPNILFVEGEDKSLDKELYQSLFPEASIVPVGSCKEVRNSVISIKSLDKISWVNPIGLVDGDFQNTNDIEDLKKENIFCLSAYSIEALYYHKSIIMKVIENKSKEYGIKYQDLQNTLISDSLGEIIEELKKQIIARIIEKHVRTKIIKDIPSHKEIGQLNPQVIQIPDINFLDLFKEEENKLNKLIENKNLFDLLKKYPLKNFGSVCSKISIILKYSSKKDFEAVALQLIRNDNEIKNQLFQDFNELQLIKGALKT